MKKMESKEYSDHRKSTVRFHYSSSRKANIVPYKKKKKSTLLHCRYQISVWGFFSLSFLRYILGGEGITSILDVQHARTSKEALW